MQGAGGLRWRGRVRTNTVFGFLLDRRFQVLLTAYPQERDRLDLEELDLRYFDPGRSFVCVTPFVA
jgi:hypothetical protein